MTNLQRYFQIVTQTHRTATKITLLNPDETEKCDFTSQMYDISGTVSVNYQNGSRRSCTLKINNDRNRNPINVNNLWFGQKFKLWAGVYLNDTTPFYFPQGVFYISNPTDIYNPNERSVTIQGVDKWGYLDGTISGNLSGTYQTNIGNNLFDATRKLLSLSKIDHDTYIKDKSLMIDPQEPNLSNYYIGKFDGFGNELLKCPYTATVSRSSTLADVLLEYAKILSASIYYDADGRLVIEPLSSLDDFDDDKEILWNYTVEEKEMTGLETSFNFDKVYNDFIVLGNIANGYQAKARVQNHNPLSNISIEKIGLKTKPPYEDSQYYSDSQCEALGKEYAKQEGMLKKSINIPSLPLFHFDVNKLITVATPKNNMTKEKYLINSYSLPLSGVGKMNVSACNVNDISNFSVIRSDVY